MKGLAYDDAKWNDFLDQLTLDDMYNMLGANGWGSAEVPSIGKFQTKDMDGPAALSYVFDAFMGTCTYETVSYPCEVLLAATWNVDLATDYSNVISKEAEAWEISGWYAPGANTHRSPFLGRNFEYYSEDGFLAGSMAAHVVDKATENGMYCYIKHFALNERETWRHYGLCTWASEQSMREIYFLPFEMAVKDGHSTAIMSSKINGFERRTPFYDTTTTPHLIKSLAGTFGLHRAGDLQGRREIIQRSSSFGASRYRVLPEFLP